MNAGRSDALAWSLFGATIAAVAVSGVFLVLALPGPEPTGAFGFRGFSSLYALAFATTGLLIATRRPENPIGWMMLTSGGLLAALQQVALQYASATLLAGGDLPGGEVAAWLQDWIWLPQVSMLGLSLLIIPDGRLPSPRWRPVVWGIAVSTALAAGFRLLVPGPVASFREVRNPFGLEGAGTALEIAYAVAFAAAVGFSAAAAVSLAQRRRRAEGEERARIRWVTFGGVLTTGTFVAYGAMYAIFNTGPAVDALEVAFVLAVMAFAGTIGIGILRFRLFDIDVVVSKTVVFGLLVAFITAVYVGVVVGIGALVGSAGNAVLSAAAAAVVAIAFQPVRRRAQRVADRLVYGERANPYEVLSGFSRRVSGGFGTEDVLPTMARILCEGVGAATAHVWLRVGPALERAAVFPPDDRAPDPVRLRGDELPDLGGFAVAVRHEGELLGALVVSAPAGSPISSTEERLVGDLANQAGLVLRNAALIADLRASRQRLVAAQDEERRRLERNLHDGAQQQLVALSIKLGLLRRTVGEDPERLDGLVDELQADSQDALETLRDLARGIYPPVLADRGLAAALGAQARRAPLPVAIDAGGIGRYPQAVEAAVYFSCLEGLQNVAKYAGASQATVRIEDAGNMLTFEIEDDGAGFDAVGGTEGTGLQGIRDRLSAQAGSLEVRSTPGEGTTLVGRIPIAG